MGHRSIKTTQIYAKVVDMKVSADMNVLFEMLSKNAIPFTACASC
jgi:site-specific recombinase XerD